jgi:type II secretory pathway pseudopilin PulG
VNDGFEPIRPVLDSETANAVQAEPPALPSRKEVMDELAVPDIRVKADRLWIIRWLGIAIILITFLSYAAAFFLGPMGGGSSQFDTAQIQVKAIAIVCDAYKEKNAKYPETLATLLVRDEFGTIWIDDPAKLIDPWGRPYQYDAKGPNNKGLHPDIWVVTPDDGWWLGIWRADPRGKTIGNWPKLIVRD